MIESTRNQRSSEVIARAYIDSVFNYRLGKWAFLMIATLSTFCSRFIGESWPDARIIPSWVAIRWNAMASPCTKQIFTWAYKFFLFASDGRHNIMSPNDDCAIHWREALQDASDRSRVWSRYKVKTPEKSNSHVARKSWAGFRRQSLPDFDKNERQAPRRWGWVRRRLERKRILVLFNKWQRFGDELNPLKEYFKKNCG